MPGEGVAILLPPRIIDKSLVADDLIIDTIVSKYAITAHSIVRAPPAARCGHRDHADHDVRLGDDGRQMLSPVVDAMRRELLASGYIQADETPIDVQTHDKRGKNHQAYLWHTERQGLGRLRFSHQPRTRRAEAVPLSLRGHSPNRRLHSLPARPGRAWMVTPAAGAMRKGTLWMRSNSTRRTPARFARSN